MQYKYFSIRTFHENLYGKIIHLKKLYFHEFLEKFKISPHKSYDDMKTNNQSVFLFGN